MRVTSEELEKVKKQVMTQYRRASSRDLEGMSFDARYFLEESAALDVRKIKKTGDASNMLQLICRTATQLRDIKSIASKVENIWLEVLCYSGFEAHAIQVSGNEMTLDFVTVIKNVSQYYTGSIIVNFGKATTKNH
jgi:hypothetical protein